MSIISIPTSIIILIITGYLCLYIYKKDKIEKEPLSLLAILFVAGALSFVVAAFAEKLMVGRIDKYFFQFITFEGNGLSFYSSSKMMLVHFAACAAAIAIVEEVIRGIVLCCITHKNKNFNYTFDGVVYAVFMYLGFGLAEAFRYVSTGGIGSALIRALCCVPSHLFLGVIMGCMYTGWHVRRKKGKCAIATLLLYWIPAIMLHALYTYINIYSNYSGGHKLEIITLALCTISIFIIRKKAASDRIIALLLCGALTAGMFIPQPVDAEGSSTVKKYNGYYYSQLDSNGMRTYNAMVASTKGGKSSVKVNGISELDDWNSIWKSIYAFYMEHPERYWIRGGATNARWTTYDYGNNGSISIDCATYAYWNQTWNKKKCISRLNQKVKTIADKARKKDSKYKQALYVHDYLTNHCYYDYDALAETQMTIHDPSSEMIYSAYGCLINGRAVCSGYAKAFQMIMKELDIPCDYVIGWGDYISNSNRHGWNRIKLGGKWYWLDVTWDDLDRSGKNNDAVHYYFLRTSKSMKKDHIPGDDYAELKQPTAKGTKYNYYEYNNYELTKYSKSKLNKVLSKQKNKKNMEVHCSKKAYKDLLYKLRTEPVNLDVYRGQGFSYYYKDATNDVVFIK